MAGECIPLFRPGSDVTAVCSVNVAGRKFVELTGGMNAADGLVRVGLPAAGGTVFGVAARDGVTTVSGGRVPVIRGAKTVLPVLAGAAITALQEVQVDATGAVIPKAAGVAVGRALQSAANGAECMITLY